MRILALIPARGGSKRLPGKNTRLLNGRPLIVWSIDIVEGLLEICDVLVSTDDENIAEIARNAGALVPWLRPAALASDTSSSVDVALHALDWYQELYGDIDGLLLLQPTSPFRMSDSIKNAIDLFRSRSFKSIVSVSHVTENPQWMMTIENNKLQPIIDKSGYNLRSQDLKSFYRLNGSIYLISPNVLKKHHSFMVDPIGPLVLDSIKESIDIDTEMDFQLAQIISKDD
jgi:CMP-N,N'-diacetyllegionaminic acid synthase